MRTHLPGCCGRWCDLPSPTVDTAGLSGPRPDGGFRGRGLEYVFALGGPRGAVGKPPAARRDAVADEGGGRARPGPARCLIYDPKPRGSSGLAGSGGGSGVVVEISSDEWTENEDESDDEAVAEEG